MDQSKVETLEIGALQLIRTRTCSLSIVPNLLNVLRRRKNQIWLGGHHFS